MSDHHQLYYHHDSSPSAAFFPYGQPTMVVDDDPPYYNNLSFTDCLHGSVDYSSLSKAFDLSPPPAADHHVGNNNNGPLTPNSSGSFSSEEDSGSICNGKKSSETAATAAGEENKAAAGEKKAGKGEKRKKEARFAFMTKSEVDHLEDGYRWRKYGQKAVKNSPYPRSYYRCTTQKCGVKKRVERSFEDPSTVITTYEGQHNHPLPSTLRGNAAAAAAMFSHSILSTPNSATFPAEFLLHMSGQNHQSSAAAATSSAALGSMYHHQQQQNFGQQQQQQQQQQYYGQHLSDYGLLQDVVPNSMFFKQEESS